MGLEALGAIAGGLNRGIDMAQRDQQIADQRALQQEQMSAWRDDRQEVGRQRSRQIAEQAREDTFRDEWAKVPEAGSQSLIPGTDVGPTPDGSAVPGQFKTQTEIGRARQQAAAAEKAGKIELAQQRRTWADQKSMEAAAQAYRGFLGSTKSTDPYEFAQGAAKLVTDDQSPIAISDVVKGEDGRVSVRLTNRHNGFNMVQQFGSIDEMKTALQAHYDPAGYDANVKRAQALQDELAKSRAKTIELAPGAQAYGPADPVTGVRQLSAANTNMTSADVQNAKMLQLLQGGAGGAGAGSGKKPNDPLAAYSEAVEFVIKNSNKDTHPTVAQAADTTAIARQLGHQAVSKGQALDPAVAAKIALEVASDPTKQKLQYDPSTGKVVRTAQYQGSNFVLEDLGDSKSARLPADKMSSVAIGFLQDMPEADRKQFTAAAFNPEARRDYESAIRAKIASPESVAVLKQRLGREPTKADIEIASLAALKQTDNHLNLVARNLTATDAGKEMYSSLMRPSASKNSASPSDKLSFGGGMSYKPSSLVTPSEAAKSQSLIDARSIEQQKKIDAEKAKAESVEARRREIADFTENDAKGLSPSRAREILGKYQDVLPSNVARALRRQM